MQKTNAEMIRASGVAGDEVHSDDARNWPPGELLFLLRYADPMDKIRSRHHVHMKSA
jgi:hypothetical protein